MAYARGAGFRDQYQAAGRYDVDPAPSARWRQLGEPAVGGAGGEVEDGGVVSAEEQAAIGAGHGPTAVTRALNDPLLVLAVGVHPRAVAQGVDERLGDQEVAHHHGVVDLFTMGHLPGLHVRVPGSPDLTAVDTGHDA